MVHYERILLKLPLKNESANHQIKQICETNMGKQYAVSVDTIHLCVISFFCFFVLHLSGRVAGADSHQEGLHQSGGGLQARHHLHSGSETPPHSSVLL